MAEAMQIPSRRKEMEGEMEMGREERRVGKDTASSSGSKRNVEEDNVPGKLGDDNGSQYQYEDGDPKHQQPGWRKFMGFIGPGFLVSMAYIDPGSLETDLLAGANHKYELLWVILVGMIFALLIQSLAANIGVTTGKHLAELCKAEYPKYVRLTLYLLTEMAVIAADIPEVIGMAFGLNILFHIPVWAGVLLTGLSTIIILGLQKYGVRKLEILIALMVFVMAGCYFVELAFVNAPPSEVLQGLFIPKLNGKSATADMIALLGALIMPHNLFLHSALVLSRKVQPTTKGINNACRYFLWESGFALMVALVINISVVTVTGTVCFADNLSAENIDRCNNLNLDSASFLLKNVLGKSSSTVYAIALLASGQSSTITDTYAGQYIMEGFLDLKMRMWLRNLITRTIAIVPSPVVSIISGSSGAGRLIIIASMVLAFELPFALIPLLKFSSSNSKMGPHKNSIYVMVVSWFLFLCLTGINVYFLSTAFVGWLIHNSLPKIANVFIGIVVFPFMALYFISMIYLMFRKDTVQTFIETPDLQQIEMEKRLREIGAEPHREDLADIPLPV